MRPCCVLRSAIVVFILVLLVIAVASKVLVIKSMIKRHPVYAKAAGAVGGSLNAFQIKVRASMHAVE